jgi:hypothetical protein
VRSNTFRAGTALVARMPFLSTIRQPYFVVSLSRGPNDLRDCG